MKTQSARIVLSLIAISVGLLLVSASARAAEAGQDIAGGIAEIERVCSIISLEQGAVPRAAAPLPVIKRDRQGRIWAAWERWESGRSRVELARFGNAGIESRRTVGLSGGDDLSPDFSFSPDGTPWVIWVNTGDTETRVLVLDTSLDETWDLEAGSPASIAGPRILFDAEGSPWAFWNAASGAAGEIVYRVLKQGKWTAPALVPRGTKWPALNPDAAVDSRGAIWLAWSGYNGQDYGIYLSRWTGSGWAPAAPVSGYPGSDMFPSLGFDADGSLLVVWARAADGRRFISLSLCENGTPGPETSLEAQSDGPARPRLIQGAGGPVVVLGSGDRIRISSLPQVRAARRPAALSSPAPRLLSALPLDENKYVGFGDSITFGYIDFYPFPERGYIPRLDSILNAEYGSQRIINEGFGGEVTAEGSIRIPKVFVADLARYILIMEGTNDVIFGEISIESSAFNLREMVRKSLAVGAFPAIATILPRFDWYGMQKVFHDRLLLLNVRIRQLAADMSIPLVDMYSAFNNYPASSGGVMSLLSADLKHPSDKGYQFMAETWFSGIGSFPFPPVNLAVAALKPEREVRTRPRPRPLNRPQSTPGTHTDPRAPFGNLLVWAHSPKIFDPSGVLGYRIYRKTTAGGPATFRLLAFVEQPLQYFDKGTTVSGRYDYALSTVRKDGIEGPLSDAVR